MNFVSTFYGNIYIKSYFENITKLIFKIRFQIIQKKNDENEIHHFE